MADTTPTNTNRKGGIPRWAITLGIVLLLGIILYNFFVGAQRKMVDLDEASNAKWAGVQSAYQRRADLIPNLVEVVKGYAEFEQQTLIQVVEARAKATQVTIDPSNITPEQLAQFQAAQGEVSSALSRLLVTVERYPDLKANQNFLELQSQLEGTENRINVARNDYNEGVRAYNAYVRKFPQSMLAGMYGFDKKAMFESQPGSETAPTVDFNTGDK